MNNLKYIFLNSKIEVLIFIGYSDYKREWRMQ